MDDFSTDISSRIGALELGDTLESYRDGALEAFSANLGPVPTMVAYGCWPTNFRCASDGSLEAAGANTALGPTLGDYGCGAVPRTNYCVQ
jgi:hypothetical protein